MTHGMLEWQPKDRIRRILVLRYKPQCAGLVMSYTDEIVERLDPETQELIRTAHYSYIKEVAKD